MHEHQEISIDKIPGTTYSTILTYPRSDPAEAKSRVREFSSIGITALRFVGLTFINGIPVLGKGCVGLVVQGILDGTPVALKIRRLDADRESMKNEGRLLRIANSVGVGPHLIAATKNLLAMELCEGAPLFKWAEHQRPNKTEVKQVLSGLLNSCFRLDAIGVDHGELSHAPKNVLISHSGQPCIVDFESASTVRRVANVTSILQYFLFGRISRNLRTSRIFPDKRNILKALSQYKQVGSVESFQRILSVLGLR